VRRCAGALGPWHDPSRQAGLPEGSLADDQRESDPHDDEHQPVPLFGTWRRIYAAVLLNLAVMLVLLYLFSRWPY
jgi:hypothetical protein